MAPPSALFAKAIRFKDGVYLRAGNNAITKRLRSHAERAHVHQRCGCCLHLPETMALYPVVKPDDTVRKLHYILTAATKQASIKQWFIAMLLDEIAIRFAVVISHDDVARPKPDPQPYQMAAAALGVAPENLLVVEDSPPGVLAAVEAGCRTLILPGYGMITADLAARAWRTVSHHDEVREIFDAHRA